MLYVTGLPAFDANYLWLIHPKAGVDANMDAGAPPAAWVVDPGDAAVVLAALQGLGLNLTGILVTHHHADHVGGIAALMQAYPQAHVIGPATEGIAGINCAAIDGYRYALNELGLTVVCIAVPGHTAGHVAYYAAPCAATGGVPWLFCGDTLFAAGCGRLFEGTPAQMHASLSALGALPSHTQVFCAHEYTVANLHFAAAVEPSNVDIQTRLAQSQALRARGAATVPFELREEFATNPYLRCDQPEVQHAGSERALQPLTGPVAVFAQIRAWKNVFS